jgi:hypothetical protein
MVKQVRAGIPRECHLGKDENGHALPLSLGHEGQDLLGVKIAIGHPQDGNRCRNAQKAVMGHGMIG